VLIDPATAQVQSIISLQYNPESLSRTPVQSASESGETLRGAVADRQKGSSTL